MNVSFLNLQPTVSRCGRRGPSALALACAVALVAGGTPGARAQDPAPTVARSDGAKAGGAKAGGATKAIAANKLVPATAETAAVTPAVPERPVVALPEVAPPVVTAPVVTPPVVTPPETVSNPDVPPIFNN